MIFCGGIMAEDKEYKPKEDEVVTVYSEGHKRIEAPEAKKDIYSNYEDKPQKPFAKRASYQPANLGNPKLKSLKKGFGY